VGACAAEGVTVCAAGEIVCDAMVGEPAAETCNDVDDDCDGSADEDFPNLGDPCQLGLGLCERQGALGCIGGAVECLGADGQPLGERCNGEDDDCDGIVDEADPELGADCAVGVGACESTSVLDCVDAEMVCLAVAGDPADEVCNDADDDCDGATDEAFEDLGMPCAEGVGACAVDGTTVCGPEGGTTCDAEPGAPGVETCDGTDEDCDGAVDEDFEGVGDACSAGIGGCLRDGVVACNDDGVPACDAVAGALVDELCNGVDDDCDEATDETFDALGTGCQVGVGVCERRGAVACGEDGGTTCDVAPGDPVDETCNGIDDDCDETTDEGEPQLVEHCGACGNACDIPGAVADCVESTCVFVRCAEGRLDLDGDTANGCEGACRPTDPPDEVCDGFDNDCDGVIDGPDVCQFAAITYCADRAALVGPDAYCQQFGDPRDADRRMWDVSQARPGEVPGAIAAGRYVAPIGDPASGGGHSTRLRVVGPALQLGFEVRYVEGRVGVGLFEGNDRVEAAEGEDPVTPYGYGYGVEVSGDAAPVVSVVRYPERAVVASGPSLALVGGGPNRVTARRDRDGGWVVRVDGAVVPLDVRADPTPKDEALDRFDHVTFYADAVAEAADQSAVDNVTVEVDADGDDIYPPDDNCPLVFNPDQADGDGDGTGTACDDLDGDGLEDSSDPCPAAADEGDEDTDGDGLPDACDLDGQVLVLNWGRLLEDELWMLDPVSGVQSRYFGGNDGMNRDGLSVLPNGRLAYVQDGSAFTEVPGVGNRVRVALERSGSGRSTTAGC
jgi:hypothetical protein